MQAFPMPTAFPLAPLGRLAMGVVAAVAPGLMAAAMATPPADLKPYPPAAAGEKRWVIRLPQPPSDGPGSAHSAAEEDRQVELIVGRQLEVDCNLHRLGGRISSETVPGWGYPIHRVSGVGPMISTRRACPPGEPLRRQFVTIAGEQPFLVRYNPRLPIVVYAPQDLEVRWRLWQAEPRQRPATPL
jgi:ecotin